MTLLHVTADGCIWRPRDAAAPDLAALLDRLPEEQPVPILIHGYRYAPGSRHDDPHDLIFADAPRTPCGHLGWPHHLGFRSGDGGLCIGFGWNALGSIWRARAEAARAGLALAALVTRIRSVSPRRRITVLAHSLGARVLVSALPAVDGGDIARAVLLVPAVLRSEARQAIATTGGRSCEIVNVTTAQNRPFDRAFELLVAAGLARSAGRGLGLSGGGRWFDLALDDPGQRARLARLGFAVPDPERRICHWSSYQRAPLFDLYRALLAEPAGRGLHPAQLHPVGHGAETAPCTAIENGVNYA